MRLFYDGAATVAMPPLVSVILPVHNRSASVARAIRSVLSQTYSPVELIVVDDGSSDGTWDVLAEFAADATLLRQERSGPYAARNRAIRAAHGDLIAFIDSDDAWLPDRLARQVPLFERREVGLVFGDARVVTPAGPTQRRLFGISRPRRGRVAEALTWGNFVPTITVLVRREALGLFEPVPLAADYLAWFRTALHWEFDYVDAVVADYTVHSGGISWDLGRSLEARLQLFGAELERTTDSAARRLLRRVIFNLSMHLALAAVRGRARSVHRPLRMAATNALRNGGLGHSAAFALHLLVAKGRHLLHD